MCCHNARTRPDIHVPTCEESDTRHLRLDERVSAGRRRQHERHRRRDESPKYQKLDRGWPSHTYSLLTCGCIAAPIITPGASDVHAHPPRCAAQIRRTKQKAFLLVKRRIVAALRSFEV
jgi:hypothetical protein